MPTRFSLLVLALGLLILGAAVLGGCGDQTSTAIVQASEPDPATVTSEPNASEEENETSTPAASSEDAPIVEGNHRFSSEVLPILESVCAQCHSTGGPGAVHLELATALDAAKAAPAIGWAIESQWMPPWPASDLSLPFVGDFSLTDDQRASLSAWVDEGANLDVDPDTPIVTSVPLKFLEDPDLTLTSANGPYAGSTDVLDDYRCMIFDPALTETEWILASHFEADRTEVAHHAIITLASGERRARADELDAAEDGVGWTCYSGTGIDNMEEGYSFQMGGWAPGAPPRRQPEGYGLPLRPGDFIIVQMHYHYDTTNPPDLSRLQLELATPEELEAVGGQFKTLRGQLYLGPAEIPCYAGDTNPLCDRSAAIQRVDELYGGRSKFIPDFMLSQCNAQVSDFAHMTDGTASSICDLPVRNPGLINSIGAHMHELGLSFRMTLNPDTPEERILLDIPDWDFDWQYGYQPVEDIWITAEDTIRVECSWNRERAPYDAVGYILWADGTGDEMCYSNITTAPEPKP